jgi:carboxymethylenebutenolidase
MGQTIEYDRPDGQKATGYLAAPDAPDAPGIVLIEEWWGVTDYMRGVADDYAKAGFRTLIPDLFRGRTAATGSEANHLIEGLDFGDAANQDVRGAALYLRAGSPAVGVTGYCMGGALTMLAAMYVSEVDAAVVFYGFPPPEAGDPGNIAIPIECHFAKDDAFFAPERGREIETKLKAKNPRAEVYWYDAKHAFCNPQEEGDYGLGHYDEAACKLAWDRTMKFWSSTIVRR